MSPSVLRQSGPAFVPRGATDSIKPKAIVHFCEDCNYEGAPFGTMIDGRLRSYCGYVNGAPVCVGKGRK